MKSVIFAFAIAAAVNGYTFACARKQWQRALNALLFIAIFSAIAWLPVE